MNAILLAFLLFQPAPSTPLRNTFVVAVETVIDNASAIDLKSIDEVFDAQMKQLMLSKGTLNSMVNDSREKDIADSANNLVFLVNACHIQAKNGSPTDKCEGQFTNAKHRIMEAINKHKTAGTWADGPPS